MRFLSPLLFALSLASFLASLSTPAHAGFFQRCASSTSIVRDSGTCGSSATNCGQDCTSTRMVTWGCNCANDRCAVITSPTGGSNDVYSTTCTASGYGCNRPGTGGVPVGTTPGASATCRASYP